MARASAEESNLKWREFESDKTETMFWLVHSRNKKLSLESNSPSNKLSVSIEREVDKSKYKCTTGSIDGSTSTILDNIILTFYVFQGKKVCPT